MTTPVEKMSQLADTAARRYAVRTAWFVSADDVRQAALAAQLDAYRRWDPARGVDLGAYLWAAARRGAKRYVIRAMNPCTGTPGVRDAEREGRMRWLTAEPSDLRHDGADAETYSEHPGVSALNAGAEPDRLAVESEFRARVAARVRALLGAQGAEFALGVLGGEWSEKEIATYHGARLGQVMALRASVAATLRADAELCAIWDQHRHEEI